MFPSFCSLSRAAASVARGPSVCSLFGAASFPDHASLPWVATNKMFAFVSVAPFAARHVRQRQMTTTIIEMHANQDFMIVFVAVDPRGASGECGSSGAVLQ